MEWISIKDNVPKKHDTVLTYGSPENLGVGITICSYADGVFRHWESDKENKHTITHWMPLPKPPEQ